MQNLEFHNPGPLKSMVGSPTPANTTFDISLFPNSGHHYYFVGLPGSMSQMPIFTTLCAKGTAWQVLASKKWIRYRFGTEGDKYGVWLAIESNLGTKKRGFPWEPEKAIPPEPLPDKYDFNETPYAAPGSNFLKEEAFKISSILSRINPIMMTPPDDIIIRITWKVPDGDVRDVDLVVDFGNTRTVALLLEHYAPAANLGEICHALRFQPRATNYEPFAKGNPSDDPCVIVDSWLMLLQPQFADMEPPSSSFSPETHDKVESIMEGWGPFKHQVNKISAKTSLVPHMFVELSPALLGGGTGPGCARGILRDDVILEEGGNFFLSSPKRYAWDRDPVGQGSNVGFWCMALNPWNPNFRKPSGTSLPHLCGQILRFMPGDGRSWPISEPPISLPFASQPQADSTPLHPKSSALTWVALAILEKAYAQVSSQRYREQLATPFRPRRLRSVLVTFPSGWTKAELDCYRAKWEEAINIFTLGHLQNSGSSGDSSHRPSLITDLDEAVASQLPIIFSEIRRMPGGESWIELVGRGKGNDAHVRSMNVDIGGGTTDIAIVDYVDTLPGAQVHLEATPLFKNSSTVAGDALVKRIIETILLPRLGASFGPDTPERKRFEQLFDTPPPEFLAVTPAFRSRLARIIRLVFIPIVNQWLKEVSFDRYGNPQKNNQGFAPCDIRSEDGTETVDQKIVEELNKLARSLIGLGANDDILPWSEPLNYDQSLLKRCIYEEFQPLCRSLAKLVASFECDLVFVSGKPSELPQIQQLLERELPIVPQRIVPAKHFPAGAWYPLSAGDGRIHDAKTVTAVGAALFMAMKNSHVQGWSISCSATAEIASENAWGDCTRPQQFDNNVFLPPGTEKATCKMLIGTPIGRKRFESRTLLPDQVYKLRWKNPGHHPHHVPILSVTIRRNREAGCPESLELVDVQSTGSPPVTLADVELQTCSLPDSGFWMDSPAFKVNWDENY